MAASHRDAGHLLESAAIADDEELSVRAIGSIGFEDGVE